MSLFLATHNFKCIRGTETHSQKCIATNKHTQTHTKYTHTHFPSLTHFLPDSEMGHFPTGMSTILARLFTQPSSWYLATSCPVASTLIYSVHFYLPVNAGSIQTSCSRPLQSKQRRTSHYEGWPTANTQINM